jgi:hypothetical protein
MTKMTLEHIDMFWRLAVIALMTLASAFALTRAACLPQIPRGMQPTGLINEMAIRIGAFGTNLCQGYVVFFRELAKRRNPFGCEE